MASQVREQSKRGPKELNAARVFFGGASEVQPDKQGRVALPAEPPRVTPASSARWWWRACSPGSRSGTATAGSSSTEWAQQALTDSDDLPDFGI